MVPKCSDQAPHLLALVCFSFFSGPKGFRPTVFPGTTRQLLGSSFPSPRHIFASHQPCSSQARSPRGWIRVTVDFVLHAFCLGLGRTPWRVRSLEQVLRLLNNTKLYICFYKIIQIKAKYFLPNFVQEHFYVLLLLF